MAKFSKDEILRLQRNNVVSTQAKAAMLRAQEQAAEFRQMMDLAIEDNHRIVRSKGLDPKREITFDAKGVATYKVAEKKPRGR